MHVHIIEKRFGKKVVLRNIRSHFSEGEMALVIGTSGAGKSTTVKCLTGVTKFKGEIRDYLPEDIGYIAQFPALNPAESVSEVLFWSGLFSRMYRSWKTLHKDVLAYVDLMGLTKENS